MRGAVGWDIGGANVKVVRIFDGAVTAGAQIPCDVTRGPEALADALEQGLMAVGPAPRSAVTLTAELADCFADRIEGVQSVLDTVASTLFGRVGVYDASTSGIVSLDEGRSRPLDVASANWHATATLAVCSGGEGVLVDLGGSTTDVIPLLDGRVGTPSRSDHERLIAHELVYAGVERTPLMAFGPSLPFDGVDIPLMAEVFATTADVYRITGERRPDPHDPVTADGAPGTLSASLRRLARMVGLDADTRSDAVWSAFAHAFRERQIHGVQRAVQMQIERHGTAPWLLGTGTGQFLLPEVARRSGCRYQSWLDACGVEVARPVDVRNMAPAIAVAMLSGRINE